MGASGDPRQELQLPAPGRPPLGAGPGPSARQAAAQATGGDSLAGARAWRRHRAPVRPEGKTRPLGVWELWEAEERKVRGTG